MSKISLAPDVSGSGTFTIAAPDSNTDRTLNLPDVTTTLVGTDAAQTLTNKTFSGAQTFGTASLAEPTGGAPLFMCRAWVNFNGTGTVAIRASGNVSSITDNGVGDYTVNFTTAMLDANYGFSLSSVYGTFDRESVRQVNTYNASSIRVLTGFSYVAPGSADSSSVSVAIFR